MLVLYLEEIDGLGQIVSQSYVYYDKERSNYYLCGKNVKHNKSTYHFKYKSLKSLSDFVRFLYNYNVSFVNYSYYVFSNLLDNDCLMYEDFNYNFFIKNKDFGVEVGFRNQEEFTKTLFWELSYNLETTQTLI